MVYICFTEIILPTWLYRSVVGNDVRGLLAHLVDHLTAYQPLIPKSRFFSRELFDHEKHSCIPSLKVNTPRFVDYLKCKLRKV